MRSGCLQREREGESGHLPSGSVLSLFDMLSWAGLLLLLLLLLLPLLLLHCCKPATASSPTSSAAAASNSNSNSGLLGPACHYGPAYLPTADCIYEVGLLLPALLLWAFEQHLSSSIVNVARPLPCDALSCSRKLGRIDAPRPFTDSNSFQNHAMSAMSHSNGHAYLLPYVLSYINVVLPHAGHTHIAQIQLFSTVLMVFVL